MINRGVVAALRLVGVRGGPCGAKGHHVHPLHVLMPQHRD